MGNPDKECVRNAIFWIGTSVPDVFFLPIIPMITSVFRVPTLRNIALTAPYGHNGYFKTLEEIVHFYNVRDVSDEFPLAECPATVNRDELGNLGLTPEEEAALVAFMKTLTDDYEGIQK